MRPDHSILWKYSNGKDVGYNSANHPKNKMKEATPANNQKKRINHFLPL